MYWNNWMGLADATYAVQVQKGVGASLLSDGSVGGSVTGSVGASVGASVGGSVGASVGACVGGSLRASVGVSVGACEVDSLVVFSVLSVDFCVGFFVLSVASGFDVLTLSDMFSVGEAGLTGFFALFLKATQTAVSMTNTSSSAPASSSCFLYFFTDFIIHTSLQVK